MSSFPALEVAIGLALTYLLLALISTTITEWFTRVMNARGKTLVQGISQLLGEDGAREGSLTKALLDHPLIKPLAQKKRAGYRKPSYIPPGLFAKALADLLTRQPQAATEEQKEAATPTATSELHRALEALRVAPQQLSVAAGQVDLQAIEVWYNQQMERVSGWYKRHTQSVVLIIAVTLTLITNANTVALVQRLWTDAPLREAVVASAKTRLEQGPPIQTVEYDDPTTPKPSNPVAGNDHANQVLPEEQQLLQGMLGWAGEAANFQQNPYWWIPTHLLGWFISALAISLGAPFWFDTLNRLMNIRSAGPSPAEEQRK